MSKTVLPTYHIHSNGYILPKDFPVEGYESGKNYKPLDTDVFVSTYPKCGTTWVQHLVYVILHSGEAIPRDQTLTKVFPHLEEVGAEFIQTTFTNDDKPRIVKTHLPFATTPWNPKAKYIFVARNPKDCLVSFYFHTQGFPKHYDFAEGTLETYFDLFLAGKVDFGSYFDHLNSWMSAAQEHPDSILILTYENLKADTRLYVLQVARFLGPTYEALLLQDEERILHKVLEHSSFQAMEKEQQRWSSQRPPGATNFVRKGIVGDWQNHLTKEQSELINAELTRQIPEKLLQKLWGENYKDLFF
jgi:hypothetical protein